MNRKLLIVLGLIAIICSWGITGLSSNIIGHYFPHRPVLDDVFFHLIPVWSLAQYFADTVVICAFAVSTFLMFKHKDKAHLILFSYATMWTVRALINILTPLGDPSGDLTTFGFFEFGPMLGMFPSGHTASVALAYWWSREFNYKNLQYVTLIFVFLEALSLWGSRGHYTIDIIGGFVLAYFCVLWMENFATNRQLH